MHGRGGLGAAYILFSACPQPCHPLHASRTAATTTRSIPPCRPSAMAAFCSAAARVRGRVKDLLPDAHADFVFCGGRRRVWPAGLPDDPWLYLRSSYLRGLLRLLHENDEFVILASAGLAHRVSGLQAFVNMASALHLIPTKGMTLPFISYGGSSAIVSGSRHGHAARTYPPPAPMVTRHEGACRETHRDCSRRYPAVISFPAEALAAELIARGHRIVLMTDRTFRARLKSDDFCRTRESYVPAAVPASPGACESRVRCRAIFSGSLPPERCRPALRSARSAAPCGNHYRLRRLSERCRR